jgi:hypothetical protein
MAMQRRALLICLVGIAALCAVVASRLLLPQEIRSLNIRPPKAPGPPIFAGNLTTGGHALYIVRPKYPRELRHLGYQIVSLRCRVAQDGTISEIRYVNGPEDLVPYAKAAVERWRYEPTRLYNRYTGKSDTVAVIVDVQVPFYGRWP